MIGGIELLATALSSLQLGEVSEVSVSDSARFFQPSSTGLSALA
jgi:hypothetical protein